MGNLFNVATSSAWCRRIEKSKIELEGNLATQSEVYKEYSKGLRTVVEDDR